MQTRIKIEKYRSEFAPAFAALNLAWIEKLFVVEDQDREVLFAPEPNIIATGGSILFALDGDEVVGCVALKSFAPAVFELTKMAVKEERRGQGIGAILMQAAVAEAKQKGIRELVLFTQSSLQNAIALYRRYGFTQVPVHGALYQRADVRMQCSL